MNKTLRIFKKDVQHLWLEIALCVTLTAAFAATEHYFWPNFQWSTNYGQPIASLMNLLLPVAWWLLITRAVQDESLVGDREFWLTRPYGWTRLLAAKCLLMAGFIALPLLLAQLFLLHQAGLSAGPTLSPLLWHLVVLLLFTALPLMALATVTTSLARALLVGLSLIVYAALTTYLWNIFYRESGDSLGQSSLRVHLWLLLPIASLAVVALQYVRRATLLSRAVLIAMVLLITAGLMLAEFDHRDANTYIPLAANEPAPFAVEMADVCTDGAPLSNILGTDADCIGLRLTGLGADRAVVVDEIKGWADSGKGRVESKSWLSVPYNSVAEPSPYLPLFTSENFLAQAAQGQNPSQTFAVHLTLAVQELVADHTTQINADQTNADPTGFDLPDHGHCRALLKADGIQGLQPFCSFPLKVPTYTQVTWQVRQSCTAASPGDETTSVWLQPDSKVPPFLSPVAPLTIGSSPTFAAGLNLRNNTHLQRCPGTPLTVTTYRPTNRRLIEVTLPNTTIPHH